MPVGNDYLTVTQAAKELKKTTVWIRNLCSHVVVRIFLTIHYRELMKTMQGVYSVFPAVPA